MNCPFSSIVCLQAGLDRDAPPRTLQKMSQKSDSFAWNFCELYLIEKTQNAFGEFRAANVSSFARPLMTSVGRPIQTHGPDRQGEGADGRGSRPRGGRRQAHGLSPLADQGRLGHGRLPRRREL